MESIILENGDEVRASFFVDGTADAKLCQAAGCELMRGQESRETFGEPDAPEQPSSKVNAVTLIYRITPRSSRCRRMFQPKAGGRPVSRPP
ncbi:MAG: FAD-dependent oxidoreductase [Spartobacteria bacterium]